MTNPKFDEKIDKMPELLEELTEGSLRMRDNLSDIPKRGIYVFYEGKKAIYVGRSNGLRNRIQEHGRPSSDHYSATLAFLMAKEDVEDIPPQITRGELEKRPDFEAAYSKTKKRIREMGVRVVEVKDPIEQSIFEMYASLALKTKYNSFDNH